jgi:membrane associated rhomboid family serine protease
LDGYELTYLLIAINVVISLIAFTRMNSGQGGYVARRDMFLFTPFEVSIGVNYPGMVLSHFSHADGGHLLFNMLTLYFFGPVVQFGLGIPVMLLIYVAAGVLSTLVVYHRHRADPNYRALGASDSVSGILFAAIVLDPTMSIFFVFVPVPIPAPVFAIAYIVLSTYFMRHGRGNISHEAHLAGAFTGLLLAGLLSRDGFGPLLNSIQNLIS